MYQMRTWLLTLNREAQAVPGFVYRQNRPTWPRLGEAFSGVFMAKQVLVGDLCLSYVGFFVVLREGKL